MTTAWKLVPVEPTPEMKRSWGWGRSTGWASVLHAAPPPPETVLTDEEMDEAMGLFSSSMREDGRRVERAILRKLGGGA